VSESYNNFNKMATSILQENDKFCKSNDVAQETVIEILKLMKDAINSVQWNADLFPKFAFVNCLRSVLVPMSNAIYYNFMGGNLPACFVQLRILLEQLVKCFLSDKDYRDISRFQEKLRRVEDQKLHLTEAVIAVEPNAESLWRNLSNDWVHMKYLERHVRVLLERGDVLGFNVVVPIDFSETELPEIQELGESISQFRAILAETVGKWKTEVFRSHQ